MADLVSRNYYQTSKRLSFFNPIRMIYFIESFLLKKYEINCLKNLIKNSFTFKKRNKFY